MRTLFKLTAISIQRSLYYKTSLILNLFTPVVVLAGQYMFWEAMYAQQTGLSIGGILKEEQFTYILLAFGVNNILSWSSENTLAREIQNGTVVSRCIRPVSFLTQSCSEMIGALIPQCIVNFGIVMAGIILFGNHLTPPGLHAVLYFIPCFLLAILLRIMLIHIFSLLCFFTTGYLGLSWIRIALFEFFSGAVIPVLMFPDLLKRITYMTPFPYMLQIPVGLLLGQELPVSLPVVYIIQLSWLLGFYLLHVIIYGSIRKNLIIAGG